MLFWILPYCWLGVPSGRLTWPDPQIGGQTGAGGSACTAIEETREKARTARSNSFFMLPIFPDPGAPRNVTTYVFCF